MEKQLSLIQERVPESAMLTIYIDGAARGNPGPAGAGIYITRNKKALLKKGFFIGEKTNNQAEYLALALALLFAHKLCAEKNITAPHIHIFSDSELLVKQMKGEYKTKNQTLVDVRKFIHEYLKNGSYHFVHVTRDKNKEADELANVGIDKKHTIPSDFLKVLSDKGLLI